jgi:hypothetical protein
MMLRCVLSSAAICLVAASSALAQSGTPFLRLMSPIEDVATPDELSQPLDFVTLADGSLVYIEFQSSAVTRLSPEGRLVWRAGRSGSGPGEFRTPYRLAVFPDQSILVFDLSAQTFTRIDENGQYVSTLRPDMQVSVNGMLVSPDGDVLLSGRTTDPRGRSSALHLFSSAMTHRRSFGDLPNIEDVELRRYVGVGAIRPLVGDGFVHAREVPYEMVRYSWRYVELGRTKVPADIDPPERWVQRATATGGRVSARSNPAARRPSAITPLGADLFLGGILSLESRLVVFDSKGRLIDAVRQPDPWSSIAAYDRARRRLWIYGERDDVPTLFRTELPLP